MEKDKKEMVSIKPIYIIMLIIVAVLYVINSCVMQSDLSYRLCKAEHKLMHLTGEHTESLSK